MRVGSHNRWTTSLAAFALAFQALALVLATPMAVARGAPSVAAATEHCGEGEHGGGPGSALDLCSVCLGMLAAGHALAPAATALPLPPLGPSVQLVSAGIEAPLRVAPRPQNPRAPPILV